MPSHTQWRHTLSGIKYKNANICEKCGMWIPCWIVSSYDLQDRHKCDYFFWKRIKEFGECVKG